MIKSLILGNERNAHATAAIKNIVIKLIIYACLGQEIQASMHRK